MLILAIMAVGGGMTPIVIPDAYAADTTITVKGYALDGSSLNMWIAISSAGSTVKAGSTPFTFAGVPGTAYTVTASDYDAGGIYFEQWSDGSRERARLVTLGSEGEDMTVLAYYKTPSSEGIPEDFVDQKVADGLNVPTAMEFAPDGRLFVSEKEGALRVIKDGVLLAEPFATISVNSDGERGLIGTAFDPNFAANGYLYAYYTSNDDDVSLVHNRVIRLTADPSNPDKALAGSELSILELEPLLTISHNGGGLEFGNDGKLYVSTGDNYYSYLSQSLSSRFGKILRINSDGTIPSDNPFYDTPGAYREIWALGLRNPFIFAFSPPLGAAAASNLMYINDVGQNSWEEINLGVKGANYGWPTCEGACPDTRFLGPVYAYPHPSAEGGGMSITGGAFYVASQFPSEYRESYYFGDYVAGFIKRIPATPGSNSSSPLVVDFLTNINSPVDVEIGPDGSLFYLSIGAGEVHRVKFTKSAEEKNNSPVALINASQTFGSVPFTVMFDASKSYDPDGDPLTYSWDFGDGSRIVNGNETAATVTHTYGTAGPYVAKLILSDSISGISTASQDILAGSPPAITISSPSIGLKYNAGDIIFFSAAGSDK